MKLSVGDWEAQLTHEQLQLLLQDSANQRRGVMETQHRRKDGSIYDVEISYNIVDWDEKLLRFCVCRDITDRKRAAQDIQAVHDSLNLAIAAAELGTWDLDLIHDTARRNLRHDQIFGYTTLQAEWGHEIAKRHAHPDDLSKFDEGFQEGLKTGELQFEARIIWPDQSLHWINVIGRVYYDDHHQPVRMAGVVIDITDRKRIEAERKLVEAALQRSEEQLRFAFDFAQMGSWDWDVLTNQITWNHNHFRLLGLDPEEVRASYKNWRDRVHPDDVVQTEVAIRDALQNQTAYTAEYRVIRPDGSVAWVLGKGQAIYDANGQPTRMLGVLFDITDQKRAEQTLQEREAVLRLFAQYAPAGIAMFDRNMRYVMTSQRWADDYHLGSLELLIGRSHYEVFPEISERWKQVHQRCMAGAIEKCEEDLFVRADGAQQWIRWEVLPWHTAIDQIGGIIVFSEDITQRKQAEADILKLNQELQHKVNELQTLLDVIPIGIGIAADPDCQEIRVNPGFAQMLGISPQTNASLSAPEVERPTSFKVCQNGRELAPEELPLQ
ncbi:MAG TPA: PAS domain S-box protein, partial [Allocoleopsis sp.]